jgi:hypothetical protein
MSLAVLVPTKGRPENAARLARAARETAGRELEALYFLCDPGESCWDSYSAQLGGVASWVFLERVVARPQRIGPILNKVAPVLADRYAHVGFMGDDHLPRTALWDEELVGSLDGRPGVAYGNDLWQGKNLPTMAVISADLVRGLGFFVPPVLEHLFLDDFWRMLGQAVGNLAYRDDVVIEHLHPLAGKAAYDSTYQGGDSGDQKQRDGEQFALYCRQQWETDLRRVRDYLSG